MREERRSRSRIQRWRPYALTMADTDQREGDWNQHGDVEFAKLVGGSTNAFGVNEWVSNTVSGYTVSGSTVTLTLGTDVQPGDETQVSYQSSTATLKDVEEEERRSRSRIQRRPMRLTMSRR